MNKLILLIIGVAFSFSRTSADAQEAGPKQPGAAGWMKVLHYAREHRIVTYSIPENSALRDAIATLSRQCSNQGFPISIIIGDRGSGLGPLPKIHVQNISVHEVISLITTTLNTTFEYTEHAILLTQGKDKERVVRRAYVFEQWKTRKPSERYMKIGVEQRTQMTPLSTV